MKRKSAQLAPIKFLSEEIIYSGHILSIGAASLLPFIATIFHLHIDFIGICLVYLLTQSIYYLDRYNMLREDTPTNRLRSRHLVKYKQFIPYIVGVYLIILFALLLIQQKFSTLAMSIIVFGLGCLYGKKFKNLTKKFFCLKDIFVSFLWLYPVLFIQIYYSQYLDKPSLLIISLFVFLKTLLMQVFFDIKDIQTDRQQGLKTFPVLFERNATLKFLILISVSALMPIIFGVIHNHLLPHTLILTLATILEWGIFLIAQRVKEFEIFTIVLSLEYTSWSFILLLGRTVFQYV